MESFTATAGSRSNTSPSPFRLFVRFAVVGLLAFLVVAFLLFYFWMGTFESYLVRETQGTKATYINALVSHMLTEEDFAGGVKEGEDWKAFRDKISDLFSVQEVVRAKIYNRVGDLIWSDSVELLKLPPPAKKNPELLKALAGRVEANISQLKKEEHRFERGGFHALMELYVPIYLGQRDKPVGVAEVYLNIDPLFATIRETAWPVGIAVIGGLGLLISMAFVGLGRAVTLIHKQNQELRTALEEIFKVTRLKNQLVSDLSREVRNPDAIMSYADLLLDGAFSDLPEKLKPSSDKLRNSAAEILSHFTRMLELSRLKVGDVRPQREPLELTELLRDIVSDLSFLCGDGTVALSLELPPDPLVVNSDRSLLGQVVFNLITNAFKFTPKGKVCVRLEKDLERGGIKIVVEDTGIGIKLEELPLIFDEFYRGNHPEARFKSGVGLGLAIVKKSLELLGGEIEVKSTYGKGSKFIVTLPSVLSEKPAQGIDGIKVVRQR